MIFKIIFNYIDSLLWGFFHKYLLKAVEVLSI